MAFARRHCSFTLHLSALLVALLALCAGAASAAEIAAQPGAPQLEVVAALDQAPGNIAVGVDGTVYVTLHSSMRPTLAALQVKDGAITPFPPDGWSTLVPAGMDTQPGLHSVLAIRADAAGQVWMLSGGGGQATKYLYVWDLARGTLARELRFEGPPGVARGSFFNDIALAPMHGTVFISDPAGGDNAALVVVDLATGTAMRRLEGHASVTAEEITAYIGGKALGAVDAAGNTAPLRAAVNPITIDAREEWVYYAAMSSSAVYRVRVADLLDTSLDETALGARVERYADKPVSAGITIDDAGNVYVTDVQANGVGVAAPGRPYRLLVQDERLLEWPDGIGVGPDGYVYVNANSLFRTMGSHRGDGPPQAPFYVTRFKALAPTTVGR